MCPSTQDARNVFSEARSSTQETASSNTYPATPSVVSAAESARGVRVRAVLIGNLINMMPSIDELSAIKHAVVAHRRNTDGERVWEVEDLTDATASGFDRRLGPDSEWQLMIFCDPSSARPGAAPVPSGEAESSQDRSPRVDADAIDISRQKVSYD